MLRGLNYPFEVLSNSFRQLPYQAEGKSTNRPAPDVEPLEIQVSEPEAELTCGHAIRNPGREISPQFLIKESRKSIFPEFLAS